MSHENLLEQFRSVHIDRRALVRGLAALAAPAIGVTLFAPAALARGGKKGKASRKQARTARKHSRGGRGASAQGCSGGCK